MSEMRGGERERTVVDGRERELRMVERIGGQAGQRKQIAQRVDPSTHMTSIGMTPAPKREQQVEVVEDEGPDQRAEHAALARFGEGRESLQTREATLGRRLSFGELGAQLLEQGRAEAAGRQLADHRAVGGESARTGDRGVQTEVGAS